MKLVLENRERIDFEQFGYQTVLQCEGDEERAKQICAARIESYDLGLQAECARLKAEIAHSNKHAAALHEHLYDRPEPVSDAAMVARSKKLRFLAAGAVFAAIACFAGNATTFYLLGVGVLLTLIGAIGATALPLIVGHLAYERIVEKHKNIQIAIIAIAALLAFAGLYKLAEARQLSVSKVASETAATTSYVDGAPGAGSLDQEPQAGESIESKVRDAIGAAMLFIMIAADVMLGFLVGLLSKMHTDEDYAAWRKIHELTKRVTRLDETVSHLLLSVEIAKRQCAGGMLRAQVVLNKRRTPYHPFPPVLMVVLLAGIAAARAQTIERYEGILIDTSGSISKNGATNELFRQYLTATKRLLTTETPSTRVWVSTIAVDSFGESGSLVKGWTPEAHGVFTDDLTRARRELARAFEQKSSALSPIASGTDIFGALWRFKASFESGPKSDTARIPKAIFLFSDMMNETPSFPMPALLQRGPDEMLERAKANGLIVPLSGYKIYVYGATPAGLTPQVWLAIKNFWIIYFQAAGAELVSYSAECDVGR